MKRFFISVRIVFAVLSVLVLSSCSRTETFSFPNTAQEIKIAPYGSDEMTFSYTDSAKTERLLTFLGSLEAEETDDSPENYTGITVYGITVVSDGSELQCAFYGNAFFRYGDGEWLSVSSEKGEELMKLLKDTEPDIPALRPLFPE